MTLRLVFLILASAIMGGCSVAAAPCRVASVGIGLIPVVGGIASTPTDACGEVVDP